MSEGIEELALHAVKIHGGGFTPGNNIQINCWQT
jgi:hypothetical protein